MRGANDVITLWNKTREGKNDVWYRHIIRNCSWEQKTIRAVSGQTASIASTIGVLISENPLYKPAKAWAAGDKAAFFTLQNGDLIARGEHGIEITGVTPNTESAIKAGLMPVAFTVRIVQDNTATYKRGRHYYVEGV